MVPPLFFARQNGFQLFLQHHLITLELYDQKLLKQSLVLCTVHKAITVLHLVEERTQLVTPYHHQLAIRLVMANRFFFKVAPGKTESVVISVN